MVTLLAAADATDPWVAGGKAAALARLLGSGFDVPAFFVIPAAAFSPGAAGPVPAAGLAGPLATALDRLGPGPYAVRSSGRTEDGATASHAGQFRSLLDVPAGGVLDAAAAVWASGFGAGPAAYAARTTGAKAEPPAIIVQRMVPARAAGVAFSADPLTGRRDRCLVSAVAGLGDRLVAGDVEGEDWALAADGSVAAPPVAMVLTEADARAVAALARRAEATLGAPQDIEWAFDGERLLLLQSRPITTALRPAAAPDDTLLVLDNSNIVESYPGIVSPLTYSFAAYAYDRVYRAFVRLLGLSPGRIAAEAALFQNLLARVDGRLYYNLSNWYRALSMLPGFTLTKEYMEGMMGVAAPLPAELTARFAPAPAAGWRRAVEIAGLVRVAFGLVWQAIRLPLTRRRFYARVNRALGSGKDLRSASLTALAGEYRAVEHDLLDRWDAPIVNDFLCMIGFGASRGLLGRWAGDRGLALHNEMMIGQGGIVSAEPAARIAAMAALVRQHGLADALARDGAAVLGTVADLGAAFDAYIAKFGDRCVAELKLESVTLAEDPAPLVAAILAQARRDVAAAPPVRPTSVATVLPGQPLKARLAAAVCAWAAARVRDRENLRFERTRIFGHARRVFLAMGRELVAHGHLDGADDIFFLTVPEVMGAIEGGGLGQPLGPLIALRRAETEAARSRPDPPERLLVRGAVLGAMIAPTAPPAPATGAERRGKGCSAGTIRAVARVILDPLQETLGPGEVLVARNTDPGWIALFANAGAIVTERGSLLSHSAIVARELGIPCVVAIADATRWIGSGETIEVDGATGLVRKLDG